MGARAWPYRRGAWDENVAVDLGAVGAWLDGTGARARHGGGTGSSSDAWEQRRMQGHGLMVALMQLGHGTVRWHVRLAREERRGGSGAEGG